ncbi:MAG: T9SS type A sorting domain-containing protein [Bacteroidales bacterium]|nr:T9SS type A sorting domain-containing protein [Bacteroidales bacterium]
MKKSLQQKLMTYSLTAAAVVVAGSANAQVVHSGAINEHVTSQYAIDIDDNGVTDFYIGVTTSSTFYKSAYLMSPSSSTSVNQWLLSSHPNPYVADLDADVAVDASGSFTSSFRPWNIGWYASSSSNNNAFGGAGEKFIGVKFDIDGATHYGWIRVDVASDLTSLDVIDWAYDSYPGVGILTGQTTGGGPTLSSVTFNVDMTLAVDSIAFDPATDLVYVTGSFLDPTWQEPGTNAAEQQLLDADGDLIYTLVRAGVAAGDYEYKYFVGSGWDGGEWAGGDNRALTVADADVVLNDYWANWMVAVREIGADALIGPNPTNGLLKINLRGSFNVQVIDMNGKVVVSKEMTNKTEIDLSDQQAGVYVVRLSNNDGAASYRIVKK